MLKLPKFFSLKALSLAIATLMTALLSACQSPPTAHYQPSTTIIAQARTPAQTAQSDLAHALNAHLASERYAVSTHHYRAEPLIVSEIDKGADDAWTTFAKVEAFRENARYGNKSEDNSNAPFMTIEDYLGENNEQGELPYLRYDDEQNSTNPDTVSRAVGMSEEYQAVSEQIGELGNTLVAHLITTNARQFLDGKGKFDQRAFQKELDELDKSFTQSANDLMTVAQGYQKSDIRQLQACMTNYKKEKLAIGKHLKNESDLDKVADALYNAEILASYCAWTVTESVLEPYHYVNNGLNKQLLQTTLADKQCTANMVNRYHQLINEGKTHYSHPEEFLTSRGDYYTCQEGHLQDEYDEYSEYDDWQPDPYAGTFGFIKAYMDMKAQEKEQGKDNTDNSANADMRGGILGAIFSQKSTPEQVAAQNLYQYEHFSITGLSHQNPTKGMGQSLYSIDYDSPTATYSAQLPVRADYARGELVTDVSAFLPVLALVSPKNALLPKDVPNGLVSFALPEELRKQIPTDVIYEAVNQGIVAGVKSLPSENFTVVDISGDAFAKEVGASRAIKINLGTKQAGKLYAIIAKQVGADLKSYVDSHPEHYADEVLDGVDDEGKPLTAPNKLKKAIDDFTTLNTSYHSDDVGGLFQLIEGIAPFALEGAVYVYLDTSGQIIAHQNINQFDNGFLGASTHSITQTRYGKSAFDKHALSRQFIDTFAQPAQVDGVALFKQAQEQKELEREALYARYMYDSEWQVPLFAECESDDTACHAEMAALEAAAAAWTEPAEAWAEPAEK